MLAKGKNSRFSGRGAVVRKGRIGSQFNTQITPIPYLKVVKDEAYSYGLAIHYAGGHTFSLAPGSPALPSGLILNSSGVLSGTATVAGMNQMPVVRATNTISGLQADVLVLLSVAARPAQPPAPTLTELSSTSLRVTKPTIAANTPAVTQVVALHGPTLPLTTANGTQVDDAFPGANTSFDITGLQAGSTRHVTLKSRAPWGDGTFIESTGFSPNVASLVLSGANTAPSYTTQPTISPSTGPVGTVFTLNPGTVAGQPTPANTLIALTQNGVDKLAQVSGNTFTSTASGPLSATWEATNGVSPNAQASASATITPAAQVPGVMAAPTGSVISASQINVTLASAPADGGSVITSYELRYSLDQVNWTVLTGLSVGSTSNILGLLASTTYYFQNAARNAVGLGPWSASLSRTTNAASGTTIQFGQFTAVGAGAKAISEADGDYGQFTVAAGIITPNTSPLAVGTTLIGSTNISVVANEYSVASLAEFTTARTAMGSAGGKTIRFRAGTYAAGGDYVLASAAYAAQATITGETGTILTGNVILSNPAKVTITGLEVSCTDTAKFAVLRLDGACAGCVVDNNYLHGVTRDPLGDYSAGGSYQNPEKGIGIANSGGYLNGCTITRNRIEHVQEGIVIHMSGAADYNITDNEIGYTYSDAMKWVIEGTAALTANKRFLRNRWHMMVGRQTDNGGNGPHSDLCQHVRSAVSDGAIIDGFEFSMNTAVLTSASRGYNIQGIVSFADGGNRPTFRNAKVCGNLIVSDSAHAINLLVIGGVFAHNTILRTVAATGGDPLGKFTGTARITLVIPAGSAKPLILRNMHDAAPLVSGDTATDTDNLILGDNGATIAYATAFDGPTFEPTTFAGEKSAFNAKAGGPADTGYGRGAIGTGIGTRGTMRDPSGWTYNAGYEQAVPSTLTTLSISEPQLPVYDSNPFFTGTADVTFTVTHDTVPGDVLQYRILNGDTSAVIVDWTDFSVTSSGSMPLTVSRAPSFTPFNVAVRGKVNTAVTDTQATKWYSGYIVATMGQSLAIRPMTHDFAQSINPSVEKLWILYNNTNGTLSSGPILTSNAGVTGPQRMSHVIATYGDGPVCIVDLTEAGTGRDETSDAEESLNRSWNATMQAPVDYIRSRGSDICLVMDHWFTNDATVWTNLARWSAPFYLRQQVNGLTATPDGTGIQPYSGQPVSMAKTYTPVHFLFDETGQGGGLFVKTRTRWFPFFGHSAFAGTATRYNPGSDTTSSGNNAWAANDRQKASIAMELEAMAETDNAYLPITLRSLPGWSGRASYGGHSVMPEGTHVSDTTDGEGLVAPYMMAAILRALGKLPRKEPRITGVTWSSTGSKVTVRISLPHGGNLSTPYIQKGAGAYAGSFEDTNWIAPTVLPETTDPYLHNVQGFSIKRASDGLRYKTGFTATIVNTGTGTGDARYGEVDIVPTVAFVNGDSIAFGLNDAFNMATLGDTNAARPHYHRPIETRTHVSGTGYGWPVVAEKTATALFTASGIAGGATAPAAFVAGNWTLTDPATSNDLTVTISALPSDGGSAITDLQYTLNAGTSWISFGAATVGTYTISGLTNGVSQAVQIRAINSVGAGTASDIKSATPSADVTAPTLSSPTDTANGANAMTGSVSTNEANGTLWWVVSTSATAPSAAQVKAGQMHTGAAAAASGSQAVTTTGVQNMSDNGLAAGTAYYTHFMHEDAATNQSAVSSADGFTTAAAATTFFTHATYFASTSNTPAGTTKMRFKAKLKMPTWPSAIKYLFTQASTGCDLTTTATNKWKVYAENSGGTAVLNVTTSVDLPTAGAWVTIEYEVDQTAGTAFVKHDGVTVWNGTGVTQGGTFQSNRKVSFLGGTTGSNLWPDCEVEYLEVYYNDTLHKRIDASGGVAAINADSWQLGGDVT